MPSIYSECACLISSLTLDFIPPMRRQKKKFLSHFLLQLLHLNKSKFSCFILNTFGSNSFTHSSHCRRPVRERVRERERVNHFMIFSCKLRTQKEQKHNTFTMHAEHIRLHTYKLNKLFFYANRRERERERNALNRPTTENTLTQVGTEPY